ncbi:epoxide hydrolase-like protein [Aulographum hederae CBS 113979]|uniref:Epoxide hydrolase-like protein n=1 Tax=Aulographum hederae CBS 113979 TaxID=1176131 RepID=A0A6G1GQN5_9PEZI|nr:epoxide hydrolase-like protein [Aulographum hederae CBS 113979]
MAPIPPLDPISDPRASHKTADLNGRKYHYLLAEPQGVDVAVGTIFLIHGWPDISMGWRYQMPYFAALGFRVVAPDLMGFGSTEAPPVPPNSIHLYGFKQASDDIAELARQLGAKSIILGGHDWGGMVVWRCALWHPTLISHVFSVCSPYVPPTETLVTTEQLVKGPMPQFGYQLHLASGEVEKRITSKNDIRQLLSGIYNSAGPNGERVFSPQKGILFENLPLIRPTRLLSTKEMDYYVDQYATNGLHGSFNWYRTREANWKDELELANRKTIDMPSLFIQANRDTVLLPSMAAGMGKFMPQLSRGEVDATHWALWETAQEVNETVKDWLQKCGVLGSSKSSL